MEESKKKIANLTWGILTERSPGNKKPMEGLLPNNNPGFPVKP